MLHTMEIVDYNDDDDGEVFSSEDWKDGFENITTL